MTAGEYCNREVVYVGIEESLRAVVQLMRTHHVGDVLVVEQLTGAKTPAGILTDRDIVIEVLAQDVDIDSVTVADVMSDLLITVTEDTSLSQTLDLMRSHGVRRLPVIDRSGALQGIISIDDILEVLAEQLQKVALLVKAEQRQEQQRRT